MGGGGKIDTLLLASSVFSATRAHAGEVGKLWMQLDRLRPYFDVETADVIRRIIKSFVPRPQVENMKKPDLYGPFMLAYTY